MYPYIQTYIHIYSNNMIIRYILFKWRFFLDVLYLHGNIRHFLFSSEIKKINFTFICFLIPKCNFFEFHPHYLWFGNCKHENCLVFFFIFLKKNLKHKLYCPLLYNLKILKRSFQFRYLVREQFLTFKNFLWHFYLFIILCY